MRASRDNCIRDTRTRPPIGCWIFERCIGPAWEQSRCLKANKCNWSPNYCVAKQWREPCNEMLVGQRLPIRKTNKSKTDSFHSKLMQGLLVGRGQLKDDTWSTQCDWHWKQIISLPVESVLICLGSFALCFRNNFITFSCSCLPTNCYSQRHFSNPLWWC